MTSIVTMLGEAQSDDEAGEVSAQIAAARDAAIAKWLRYKRVNSRNSHRERPCLYGDTR